jgi:hypothetical protein
MAEKVKVPTVKYKKLVFGIRPDNLNRSRLLIPLVAELRKAEREAVKETVNTPDYFRYSTVLNEIDVYEKDIKDAKGKKNEKEIIEAGRANIEKNLKQLNEPVLVSIAQRYMDELLMCRIKFSVDVNNIKVMAEAFLAGDVSKIDFENLDDDFWSLAETLQLFFYAIEPYTRVQNLRV